MSMPEQDTKSAAAVKSPKPAPAASIPVEESDPTPTVPVSRLIAEGSDFLGYEPADVAGAFFGEDESAEFTISEAKSRVANWLQTEMN